MPSVTPYLNCTKLEYWCPAFQQCVSCIDSKVSVGNHAVWIVESYGRVSTNAFELYNATITTVEINTTIEEGTSMFDKEWFAELKLIISVDGVEKYREVCNTTGLVNSRIKFDVNLKVNGRVVITYEIKERAASGWIKRSYSNPVVNYVNNPSSTVARLFIDSYPSGAIVYVDGSRAGIAPVTVDVSPGYHDIAGELTGYRLKGCGYSTKLDSMCRVNAAAGSVTTVVLEFEQTPPPSPLDILPNVGSLMIGLFMMVMISPMVSILNTVMNYFGKR